MLRGFHHFCDLTGIRRHLTTTYTPQQNREVERKKRTMVEIERSMLDTKGLNNQFWGDAFVTIASILN